MKNKVLKNVVLSLCVLGLVFLPVTSIFATDYSFNSSYDFASAFNAAITFNATDYASALFLDSIPSRYSDLYSYLLNTYSFDEDNLIAIVLAENADLLYMKILTCDRTPYQSYPSNLTNSSSPRIYFSFPSRSSYNYYIVRMSKANGTFYDAGTGGTTDASSYTFFSQNTTRSNFAGFVPYNISISPSNQYYDTYTLTTSSGGNSGGGNGGNSEYTFSSVVTPIPAQLNAQLFNAYMYARWQEISTKWSTEYANASDFEWVFDNNEDAQLFAGLTGIGSVLESYSINSYSFYNNVSQNLANGMTMLSSLSTGIDDISDRLTLAFPDDQAELNDSIAETLLDDTNNTGLTAEKVSNAKSDFDEGVSMYQIDISQSEYSTPFSAIQSGDWSFWSSTTLNNLGSGYQYTYTPQTRSSKKASNDDDDIYESNQKSLFDLLGW